VEWEVTHRVPPRRGLGLPAAGNRNGVNIPLCSEIGRNIDFVTNHGLAAIAGIEEWI
jgi:hypothetical protein